MTADDTHTRPGRGPSDVPGRLGELALMIAWLGSAPERVGDLAIVPSGAGPLVVGRGGPLPDDPGPRLAFAKRGGAGHPLTEPTISRVQLTVRGGDDRLLIERRGKADLLLNGVAVDHATLAEGDAVLVGEELLLMCVRSERPVTEPDFAFGEPDAHGIVGESLRAWALRDELRFYAGREGHVLVQGPSGAGKELCARAIHRMSARSGGPFVARNAATLPAGIIDAELFGNAKNYPNAGMRERPGLIGEANRGTLFLDEVGELPEALQAHLLRVLDAGEYHRLGEDRARTADVRLVGATNRSPEALKHDLLARFKVRLVVPGLNDRREDIPLLVRHILKTTAARDPELAARYFVRGEPRVDASLVLALLFHAYTTHVRELDSLLLAAMATSRGGRLARTPAIAERIERRPEGEAPKGEDERAAIERALAAASGNVSVAWKILGLSSRDALNRLIKKHGIVVQRS